MAIWKLLALVSLGAVEGFVLDSTNHTKNNNNDSNNDNKINRNNNMNSDFTGCRARVAHCIVGHARSFPMQAVHQSITRRLIQGTAPLRCLRTFYVLSMSSTHDSSKGGTYSYTEELLWQTAWRELPPSDFLLDPPMPPQEKHKSFNEPTCNFQCVHMFDKVRRCFGLVKRYEKAMGQRFDWVVRSRPDVFWNAASGVRRLHHLRAPGIYVSSGTGIMTVKDVFQAVPRRFATQIFEQIFDRCLVGTDIGRKTWICCTWLELHCQRKGIRIYRLPLRFDLVRLPTSSREHYDIDNHWRWQVKLKRFMAPSSVFVLGQADEEKWKDMPGLPGRVTQAKRVTTVADSSACTAHSGYLVNLRFKIDQEYLFQTDSSFRFGVWRHRRQIPLTGLAGKNSMFHVNASQFLHRRIIPRDHTYEYQEVQDINLHTPVYMIPGDCVFWSVSTNSPALPSSPLPEKREERRTVLAFDSEEAPTSLHGLLASGRLSTCSRYDGCPALAGPFLPAPSLPHSFAFTMFRRRTASVIK
ncbi:unnamed protein product [Polarella glacialis]|uniref:Protein xylosyltransferase n=1 Tax=Polarella glacialis TaxID=89957 RepID=A0A813DB62_POLGL|nr:unnamed protein product [Polarella glacialis]